MLLSQKFRKIPRGENNLNWYQTYAHQRAFSVSSQNALKYLLYRHFPVPTAHHILITWKRVAYQYNDNLV